MENEKGPTDAAPGENVEILQTAVRQLTEYFAQVRRDFDLPIALEGTPFQRRVWHALTEMEDPQSEFMEFCETRSSVVHTGATRLSRVQRSQFATRKEIPKRCLLHELELVPPSSTRSTVLHPHVLRNCRNMTKHAATT